MDIIWQSTKKLAILNSYLSPRQLASSARKRELEHHENDMRIGTIQEYTNADNQSGETITLLVAPLPAIPASTLPAAVNTGLVIVSVTMTGISTGRSGFYDTHARQHVCRAIPQADQRCAQRWGYGEQRN
jgi:hypothetical protein